MPTRAFPMPIRQSTNIRRAISPTWTSASFGPTPTSPASATSSSSTGGSKTRRSRFCRASAKSPGDFINKYSVGEGLDIGGIPDALALYREVFSRIRTARTWDLEGGDAQSGRSGRRLGTTSSTAATASSPCESDRGPQKLAAPRQAVSEDLRVRPNQYRDDIKTLKTSNAVTRPFQNTWPI